MLNTTHTASITPDRISCQCPSSCRLIDGGRRVEEMAVRGLIHELSGHVIVVLSEGVSKVDATHADREGEIFQGDGHDFVEFSLVYFGEDRVSGFSGFFDESARLVRGFRQTAGSVELEHLATLDATNGLHGSWSWATAHGDCPYALSHHVVCEDGACG